MGQLVMLISTLLVGSINNFVVVVRVELPVNGVLKNWLIELTTAIMHGPLPPLGSSMVRGRPWPTKFMEYYPLIIRVGNFIPTNIGYISGIQFTH